MKSCCFTGHRPDKVGGYDENNQLADYVKKQLQYEIIIAISHGYTRFITGGAIGVDTWAAEIVLALRNDFGITLEIYKPFVGQERMWNKETKERYFNILSRADKVVTVCEGGYAPWKMQKRNIAMVDNASLIIGVHNGSEGGTGNCIKYAKSKKKDIVIINPLDMPICP